MIVISLVRPSPLAAQMREISSWYLHMTPMGNEVWRIGALFGAILVGIGAGKLLKYLLAASSERLEAKHHRYSAVALSSLSRVATLAMALIGLRVGVRFLHMVPQVETMIDSVISILATIIVAWAAYVLVDVLDAMMSMLAEREPKVNLMTCYTPWCVPVLEQRSSFWHWFKLPQSSATNR